MLHNWSHFESINRTSDEQMWFKDGDEEHFKVKHSFQWRETNNHKHCRLNSKFSDSWLLFLRHSRQKSLKQHRINVDAKSWRCIDVDVISTSFARWASSGFSVVITYFRCSRIIAECRVNIATWLYPSSTCLVIFCLLNTIILTLKKKKKVADGHPN